MQNPELLELYKKLKDAVEELRPSRFQTRADIHISDTLDEVLEVIHQTIFTNK